MSTLGTIANRLKATASSIYAQLPVDGIERPVFIIGCGRSGTTIFGTALSQHRQITYLNEPRHLWFTSYPETDIWSDKAAARGGKMALTASDENAAKSEKLRRVFRFETVRSGRPQLVEKLPINNFRLPFISAIFPGARFIHIYRNGLEVARSIDKMSQQGRWFGSSNYKWQQLSDYAAGQPDTAALPPLCDGFYDQGLLEWRLSTEAVVNFLRPLPADRFLEISYGQLMDNPPETLNTVLSFLNLPLDGAVTKFATETIQRKSQNLTQAALTDKEARLGGALLPLSMIPNHGLATAAV